MFESHSGKLLRWTHVVVVVCLPGLLCSGAFGKARSVPWQKTLNYEDRDLYPISVGKYGFPLVKVAVNGRELDLVWDTGNMAGLLLSPSIIQGLALPAAGEQTFYTSAGEVAGSYPSYRIDQLKAFGGTLKDERAYEYQGDLNGLIGPRYVLSGRFTLDCKHKLIAVSGTPLPEQVKGRLPMVISRQYPGLILVHGSANGQNVLVEIDTGKSRTAVDPALVSLLRLPKTASGYRIDEIKLGSCKFKVPAAKVVGLQGLSRQLPEPIMLGIGSDILSKVVLTVDYPQQVMLISR